MLGKMARSAALAVAAGATLYAGAIPSVAPAQIGDAVFARAVAVAGAHWPGSPCQGRESVVWVPQAELDADYPGRNAAADASARDCSVRLTEAAHAWSGPKLCAMLEHEFGHLAGQRHSDDPADVMYEGQVPWTEDCTRAFPPPKATSPRWRCELARAANMTFTWDCRARRRARGATSARRTRSAPQARPRSR